jgi:opacity protein-like surface antigen
MKRIISIVSAVLIIFCSTFSLAAEKYIEVYAGGVFPQDLEVTDKVAPAVSIKDLDLDNGYTAGIKAGFVLPSWEYLCPEIEFFHITGTDGDTQHAYTYSGVDVNLEGNVTVSSLFLNAKFRKPDGRFHPYAGFGIGWAWMDWDDVRASATVSDITFITSKESESDNGLAWQLFAGIEYDLVENLALTAGWKYFIFEADMDKFQAEVDYAAHMVTVGLRFSF